VDRNIFLKLVNKQVDIINDENFLISGKIVTVFDDSIELLYRGKLRYLSFDRIKEIRLNRGLR
jgi:hypothetical protein